MKVLAELFQGVESETPYGGRAVSWDPLGWAMVGTGSVSVSSENPVGAPPLLPSGIGQGYSVMLVWIWEVLWVGA